MQKSILQHASALLLEQVKGKLSAGADPDVLRCLHWTSLTITSRIIFTSITSKKIVFEMSFKDQNSLQLRDLEAQLPSDIETERWSIR